MHIEHDFLGRMELEERAYYGIQTVGGELDLNVWDAAGNFRYKDAVFRFLPRTIFLQIPLTNGVVAGTLLYVQLIRFYR